MILKKIKSLIVWLTLAFVAIFVIDYYTGLGIIEKLASKKYCKIAKFIIDTAKEISQSETWDFDILQGETSSESVQGDFYQIYFSQTYSNNHKKARDNTKSIDRALLKLIDQANHQVYAAIHQLNNENITEALIRAKKRGVDVKIMTEAYYIGEDSIKLLRKADVPVHDDGTSGSPLMHNKFFVIDGEWVWTGSLNPTYNGAYKNNNNGICIHSKKIADNYLLEFNELYEDQSFGGGSDSRIPNEVVKFDDGTTIQTLFSPENDVGDHLISELENAEKSIQFLAFSFTHKKMGKVMMKKFKEGITVQGVFEARQNRSSLKNTRYYPMKNAGIDVREDKNKYNMHHKVIIIDGQTVITGSFNFSSSGDRRNDENVLIIKNNPIIAKAYQDEFYRIYEKGVQ